MNFASVIRWTWSFFAIADFEKPASRQCRMMSSLPVNFVWLLFRPLGRPKITPSARLRANASFVRCDIRFRSISADKLNAKARTFERYRDLTHHFIPIIGEYELNDLSPMILQKAVSDLLTSGNRKTGKGLSLNTVNSIISVMQNSLKTAFTIGLTDTYSADKIKRPKTIEKAIECFSLPEQKAIERYCKQYSKWYCKWYWNSDL